MIHRIKLSMQINTHLPISIVCICVSTIWVSESSPSYYAVCRNCTYHLSFFLLFFTIWIVLVSPSPSPSSSSTSILSRPLFGDIVTWTLKSLLENTCEYSYIRTTHSTIIPLHSHRIGLNFSEIWFKVLFWVR